MRTISTNKINRHTYFDVTEEDDVTPSVNEPAGAAVAAAVTTDADTTTTPHHQQHATCLTFVQSKSSDMRGMTVWHKKHTYLIALDDHVLSEQSLPRILSFPDLSRRSQRHMVQLLFRDFFDPEEKIVLSLVSPHSPLPVLSKEFASGYDLYPSNFWRDYLKLLRTVQFASK